MSLGNKERVFAIIGLFIPLVGYIGLLIAMVVLCAANINSNLYSRRIAVAGLIISLCSVMLTWLLWDYVWVEVWEDICDFF